MNERNLSLKPMTLMFLGTGSPVGNNPAEQANRILSHNLVYACKDKAKSAKELSEELCVPMLYIENELEFLVYGINGDYGLLRKEGDKYIANIVIAEEDECDIASNIYIKNVDIIATRLRRYMKENKEQFLQFPYLSEQTDLRFVLWSLISECGWFANKRVASILETEYFKDVEQPDRPYTLVAIANDHFAHQDGSFYGCDGNYTYNFHGYPYVFISNIYGYRMDPHYRCGYRLPNDEKLSLTIKAVGGLSAEELTEEQKEVAAKAIECGFLRKVGDVLEPRIVTIDKKDWGDFGNLLQGYHDSLDDICHQIAEELHEYMVSHIPKHLLGEWKFYNQLIAGTRIIHELIEKCIEEDLLTVPENRIGPEGVLLVVEK